MDPLPSAATPAATSRRPPPAREPVTILRARRVRTMAGDGERHVAAALAIAGERIVGTGTVAELREQFAGSDEVDLDWGRSPGGCVGAFEADPILI